MKQDTSVAPGNTVGGGSRQGIPDPGFGPFFMGGLTNGTTLYSVVTAVVSGAEGTPSPVYGPVTIGTPVTTGVTVEGTVSLSGVTPTGSLCVMFFSADISTFFGKCFPTPTSVQPFSFDNVPDGYYQIGAGVDMNNNGVDDPGDMNADFPGLTPALVVQGAPLSGLALTVPTANGNADVFTDYVYPGTYTLFFMGKYNRKLITNMSVSNGPNLTQSIDVPWDNRWFDTWRFALPGRPSIGDTYTLMLHYSDGTVETPSATITAILDGYAAPVSPSGTILGLSTVMTWLFRGHHTQLRPALT